MEQVKVELGLQGTVKRMTQMILSVPHDFQPSAIERDKDFQTENFCYKMKMFKIHESA